VAGIQRRSGIPTKVMSEQLGHSRTAITEDLYSPITKTMQEEAAAKLGALVFGSVTRS